MKNFATTAGAGLDFGEPMLPSTILRTKHPAADPLSFPILSQRQVFSLPISKESVGHRSCRGTILSQTSPEARFLVTMFRFDIRSEIGDRYRGEGLEVGTFNRYYECAARRNHCSGFVDGWTGGRT